MAKIIRCLWGEERPDCRWSKVWHSDVLRAIKRKESCPFIVYCYGKRNADELTKIGIDCELVHDDPFPDGRVDWDNGNTMVRPWHYKHELIKEAAQQHGAVIYVDWDVKIRCHDDRALFAELEGQGVLLSAYYYQNWRPTSLKRKGRSRHITPSGNWIYCEGSSFPAEILRVMRSGEGYIAWHDEYAMNDWIDSCYGGWPGEREWLRRWESPFMVQYRGRCPWNRERISQDHYSAQGTPTPFVWQRVFSK